MSASVEVLIAASQGLVLGLHFAVACQGHFPTRLRAIGSCVSGTRSGLTNAKESKLGRKLRAVVKGCCLCLLFNNDDYKVIVELVHWLSRLYGNGTVSTVEQRQQQARHDLQMDPTRETCGQQHEVQLSLRFPHPPNRAP